MIALRVRQALFFLFVTWAAFAPDRWAHAESAGAAATWVVLVRPSTAEGAAGEVLNRVHGELLADGFNVLLADAAPGADRSAALIRAGRAANATVVAGLYVDDSAKTIDLSIVDALTGSALTRRLGVDPSGLDPGPEVLARRAVELLRASLLDFLVANLHPPVADARAAPKDIAPAPGGGVKTRESPWAFEAGLGVLGSFGGVGAAIVPLARVRLAVSPVLQIRAMGAWLGTQPRIEMPTGTATVEQGIALLEGLAQFGRGQRVRPLLSIGAGTYYVGVNGSGTAAYQGVRSTEFAFAVDAGAGLASFVGAHLEVVLEAHALVTEPGIAIRFLDVDTARIGRPSILGTLTVVGWI